MIGCLTIAHNGVRYDIDRDSIIWLCHVILPLVLSLVTCVLLAVGRCIIDNIGCVKGSFETKNNKMHYFLIVFTMPRQQKN